MWSCPNQICCGLLLPTNADDNRLLMLVVAARMSCTSNSRGSDLGTILAAMFLTSALSVRTALSAFASCCPAPTFKTRILCSAQKSSSSEECIPLSPSACNCNTSKFLFSAAMIIPLTPAKMTGAEWFLTLDTTMYRLGRNTPSMHHTPRMQHKSMASD